MDTVITIATVPAILALVNVAKSFGLPVRWAALLAIVLGVSIVMGEGFMPDDLWAFMSKGLILGLSAAGVYDAAKIVGGNTVVAPVCADEELI